MSAHVNPWMYWLPRVLGVLFVAFLSVFALDALGEGQSLGERALAVAMHLVPSAIVLAALAVAWRWGGVGGLIFLGLGIAYIITAWGRFHWSAYAAIAGPPLLIGALFELDWFSRKAGAM